MGEVSTEAPLGGWRREMEVRELQASAGTSVLRCLLRFLPEAWSRCECCWQAGGEKEEGWAPPETVSWRGVLWEAWPWRALFTGSNFNWGRNELKVPEAVGIVSPPTACAAGRKGLREGQALLEQNIASHPSCCMNHGHGCQLGDCPSP